MFIDMNNRTLKVGDFVLFDFDVRDKVQAYGILLSDTKILSCSGTHDIFKIGDKKKDTFCYLIENPTSDELIIKNRILTLYNKSLQDKLSTKTSKDRTSGVCPNCGCPVKETWSSDILNNLTATWHFSIQMRIKDKIFKSKEEIDIEFEKYDIPMELRYYGDYA